MGHEHVAAVLARSRQEGSQLFVLVVIAHHAAEQGEWRTDHPTLQREARLKRRRVQRILAALVASGELAVIPGDGRGHASIYRLLISPERAAQRTPFSEEAAAKGGPEDALSAPKGGLEDALSAPKGGPEDALSAPPGPPFPPYPQIPPYPPEDKKETDKESFALAPRPLAGPQSATFRVNLILEEASIPLPSPSQIGLWVRKLGGIEPLLEILRRLIQAGLVNKKNPAAYVHRVVMERAERPEPARPLDPQNARVLLRTAGADDARRRRAQEIIDRAQERQGKP